MLYKKKMVPLAGPVIGITNIGGARSSVCGRSRTGSARLVHFSRQPLCCKDVGGDGSGGYFSTAAGRPHHIITL